MLRQLFNIQYLRIVIATSDPIRRFQVSLVGLFVLVIFGTVVYILLEGMSWIDALYMTVITIATVGFSEVKELSSEGRLFTIFLILMGVGVATTVISNAFSIVVGPLLWSTLEQRRMKQKVTDLNQHYIVCGYGRMGRQIVHDLRARDEKFIVIDASAELEPMLLDTQTPYLIGDAMDDDVLLEAGVERAQGIVSALSDDASNVMTVLSARELSPQIYIVARVIRAESESKVRRAGANEVINPYQIGGHRIALSLLRPAVHDFLTHIFNFDAEHQPVDVGQIIVAENSSLAGQTVATCGIRNEYSVNILGIIQPTGEQIITPHPNTTILNGATLIVIGNPKDIYTLEQMGDKV
jgi:voltage-gated potassium channel